MEGQKPEIMKWKWEESYWEQVLWGLRRRSEGWKTSWDQEMVQWQGDQVEGERKQGILNGRAIQYYEDGHEEYEIRD